MDILIDGLENEIENLELTNCELERKRRFENIYEQLVDIKKRWSQHQDDIDNAELQLQSAYERMEIMADMAYDNGSTWED